MQLFGHGIKKALLRTVCFGGQGRDDWIRTSDPHNPIVVRYRTALHPVKWQFFHGTNATTGNAGLRYIPC